MPEFLTKRFLLAVLRGLIEAFGGRLDLRDEARLEATLAAPQATFRGAEPYPTLAAKAAAYQMGSPRGTPSSTAINAPPSRPWTCSCA